MDREKLKQTEITKKHTRKGKMELHQIKKEIDGLSRRRSTITVEAMAVIQPEVDEINGKLKDLQAKLDAKVAEIVAAARKATGKKSGVCNVEAEGVEIKHTVPKKATWDQGELGLIYRTIEAAGDDPADYIKTEYKVDERSFQAWPKPIKARFTPARTEGPGKPSYQITIKTGPGFNMPGK